MRALLAQLAPTAGEIETNLARLEALLAEHEDVELAVFPELFLQGYRLTQASALACAAEGEEIGRVRAAAARAGTAVVVGFAERVGSGKPANSAACVAADGSLAGVARKVQLFGPREREVFREGAHMLLASLSGREVGVLICFDAEFPEPARRLACAGADLLVTIAANMKPYGPEQELACRARALENRCPHLYVNSVGSCGGLSFVGGSCVIDACGQRTALAGQGEQVLEVEVPPRWGEPCSDVNYLNHIRFDLPVRVASVHTRGENR